MLVRPRRTATIRTRLDAQTVMDRLSTFLAAPPAEGLARVLAHGHFLRGSVGPSSFDVDYHYNNPRNPQTYAVEGVVEETAEWRLVHLTLTAHAPWIEWWMLALIALVAGLGTYGRARPGAAVMLFLFVVAVVAGANLLYIPDAATGRVADIVARTVGGSVLRGGQWVVPPD